MQAVLNDRSVRPPGMPRLDYKKLASWRAVDEWNFARIMVVALRAVLCQRKVSSMSTSVRRVCIKFEAAAV